MIWLFLYSKQVLGGMSYSFSAFKFASLHYPEYAGFTPPKLLQINKFQVHKMWGTTNSLFYFDWDGYLSYSCAAVELISFRTNSSG